MKYIAILSGLVYLNNYECFKTTCWSRQVVCQGKPCSRPCNDHELEEKASKKLTRLTISMCWLWKISVPKTSFAVLTHCQFLLTSFFFFFFFLEPLQSDLAGLLCLLFWAYCWQMDLVYFLKINKLHFS